MQHPDEGVIHTWLDGELPAEEAAALETHIAECADCAAQVAEARGLIAASSRIVSALDIVPGDVIPAASPRKRPWHASTQLRAAAAVIIVAGASLIVIQRERAPDEMDRLTSRTASVESAPTAATTEDAGSNANAPVVSAPAEQPQALRKAAVPGAMKLGTAPPTEPSPRQRFDARSESAVPAQAGKVGASKAVADAAQSGAEAERRVLGGRAVGPMASAPRPAVAPAVVAPPTAAPPAAVQLRSLSKSRDSTARFNDVVVTGSASATASGAVREESVREAKLREVKADTTGNVVVTTYELSPGIRLTLTETAPQAFAPRRDTDQKKEKSATANENLTQSAAKIETVTWTVSSTGRTYTLSGPLTREQLTALRKRLPADKR